MPAGRRGPGRPPAADGAETRQRIVEVAQAVFGELGYDAATFQAIATRADLTRSAINHYFTSKRALFREVLTRANDKLVAVGAAHAAEQAALLDKLSVFTGGAVQIVRDDPSMGAFIVTAMLEGQRHPGLMPREDNPLWQARTFLTAAVTDAIAQGELITEADPAELVELLVATNWGLAFYGGFIGTPAELDTVNAHLEALFANRLWRLRGTPGADG
ncbi:TetR/AcrR family transcriptional regulator [Mycolicibacillus parakoreensis]|uniref:TetR/AcrR family transcriptional regulator n=1 Tax=Mycolicibacillus parakoreensis TaxID=1069221 RepID=A0ABY3U1I2_9MYCO|nr:TetR/AcrR family transcriptional regulator [Mycolicibacillus parakoreensis]MCV7316492.1 TetR/AcrR family transcriptional regulator [Mycolicibacillus parakoreensis]ULN52723.1 TetR/AcrR family transcriptional regulator [Mycolicibacillus parakoreensis]HLR99078.1 TetR/AcrR family transcriptional regulator [Mycolicibacillus parakoreensis]